MKKLELGGWSTPNIGLGGAILPCIELRRGCSGFPLILLATGGEIVVGAIP